jgi:uncharacterized phage-associated protein
VQLRGGDVYHLTMATVHDVAQYVLGLKSGMSAMKLQKLVYYCQAWHLVWDDEPLFNEPIRAWANGPVVHELYEQHRGKFNVASPWPCGSEDNLTKDEKQTIHAVLDSYGDLTGQQLSDLTHREAPWRNNRLGLGPLERSSAIIPLAEIGEYYSIVASADEAEEVRESFTREFDPGDLERDLWQNEGDPDF